MFSIACILTWVGRTRTHHPCQNFRAFHVNIDQRDCHGGIYESLTLCYPKRLTATVTAVTSKATQMKSSI